VPRETCTRDHLDLGSVSKKVYQCKPSAEHIEHHVQVVKEVKRRDEYDKILKIKTRLIDKMFASVMGE
jgi:hypothetical protein